ncbi:MAG TPA: aquaporin [Candidatus Acidoferrales bacterium]|nr:aquaporin [Candidatus Acidoferrales bacterium]
MYGFFQKIAAEFFGTFAIVLIGAGSICADRYLQTQGHATFGLAGVALAYGFGVAAMVSALAHISGAHLNPAVTVGMWVNRRLDTLYSFFYIVAQLVGSLAAAYLLVAALPESAWVTDGLGTPDLAPDITRWRGMVIAGVLAAVIVFVYFATIVDESGAFRKFGGFAVGLAVTADVLFGTPFVGASAANPARTFGTALASRHWHNHGVFWIGPLFGAIIAAVVYERFFLGDQPPSDSQSGTVSVPHAVKSSRP